MVQRCFKVDNRVDSQAITLANHFTTIQCSINSILIYATIGIIGVTGNINTCVVILSNKYMHTATNCYLFNIAVSDLMTLICGVPIYNFLPIHTDATCKLRLLMAIGSVYVTKLTVAVLSVERYIAICHPFYASKRNQSSIPRAMKIILMVWLIAFLCALPMSFQFTLVHNISDPTLSMCTVSGKIGLYLGGVSSLVFSITPLLVLCKMYFHVGLTLKKSTMSIRSNNDMIDRSKQRAPKLLTAVVLAFFVCWAPVTINRMLIVMSRFGLLGRVMENITWLYLYAVSEILFYLSSLVNPIVYNLMSKKFRRAFKDTLTKCCRLNRPSEKLDLKINYENVIYSRKRNAMRNETQL